VYIAVAESAWLNAYAYAIHNTVKNKISRRETMYLRRWQFDVGISMVQLPAECFWSGAADGFVAVSATSGVRPRSGFDFQQRGFLL